MGLYQFGFAGVDDSRVADYFEYLRAASQLALYQVSCPMVGARICSITN